MRPDDILARARKSFDNLNDRERLLISVMGATFALLIILLPLFFVSQSIDELDETNESISDVLRDIRRAGPALSEMQAEREATARLYQRKAPALGSFVERKAGTHSLTIREVNDSPEQALGEYTRRHVRVSFNGVPLLPVVELMTEIENSRLPVAIVRIQIEHFREGNNYNVKLGVAAYDAEGAEVGAPPPEPAAQGARSARGTRRAAGAATRMGALGAEGAPSAMRRVAGMRAFPTPATATATATSEGEDEE